MNRYLVGIVGITFLVTLSVPLDASNSSGEVKEARLFGSYYRTNELGLPALGNRDLLKKLSEVKLKNVGKSSDGKGIKIVDVQLKDLVGILQSRLQSEGEWNIRLEKKLDEVRVSGTLDQKLVNGLIDLMKERQFYCKITDGVIELRQHSPSVREEALTKNGIVDRSVRLKPEFVRSREDLASGSMSYSADLYTGNANLIDLVKKEVKLEIGKDNNKVNDIALMDLATLLNSKIRTTKNWKIIVNDKAMQLRVSGDLNTDLIKTLDSLMSHQKIFHCRFSDGVIELRKGGSLLRLRRGSSKN